MKDSLRFKRSQWYKKKKHSFNFFVKARHCGFPLQFSGKLLQSLEINVKSSTNLVLTTLGWEQHRTLSLIWHINCFSSTEKSFMIYLGNGFLPLEKYIFNLDVTEIIHFVLTRGKIKTTVNKRFFLTTK